MAADEYVLVSARVRADAVAVCLNNKYMVKVALEWPTQCDKGEGRVGFEFPGNGALVPDDLVAYLKKDKAVQFVAKLEPAKCGAGACTLEAEFVRVQQVDYKLESMVKLL